ncbi:MAG: family 16 glycoside hydrolase [Candidatus Eisenbacteria bacterium]
MFTPSMQCGSATRSRGAGQAMCPARRGGFTLTEMMVVVLIMGIVATGLYQVLTTSRASYEQQKVTLEMQQNARVAIESIADDFRHVSYGKDPTQPSIHYAGPDSVTFVADIMQDIPGAERISYSLSLEGDEDTPNPFDTVMLKTVADSGGVVLLQEAQSYGIKFAGLAFEYFNGAGVALANPVPHPELIGEVMIQVTAVEPREHKRTGTYMEETLGTTVYPRNLPLTPARSRPSMPQIGTLTVPNCESVTVPWSTPTTHTDGTALPLEDISHFTVYFGTHPDSMGLFCRTARTINQWTVSGMIGGHHYYFGVTCTSRAGVESYAGMAQLDLTSPRYPDIPANLTWQVNPSGPGVRLDWTAVTTFEDATPITTSLTYGIYRSSTAGVVPTAPNRIAVVPYSNWYVDTTLTECDDFYYIVTAQACGNEGTPSAELNVSFPSAPRCVAGISLELTEYNGEVLVAWTPPTQRADGSALASDEISNFRIFYQMTPYIHDTYVDVPGGYTDAVVTGLAGCEVYYFNVTAIDDCGHPGAVCDYNETSIRTADPCDPEPPAAIAALHAFSGPDRVDLSWAANQTDCDLDGYFVYYGPQTGGPYNGTGATQGPSPVYFDGALVLDGDSCRAALTGLEPCASYAIVVKAADSCDPANQGAPSPEALLQTECTPCAAQAGCAGYLANGTGYPNVRLEIYPTDGQSLTLSALTGEWSGAALIDQVWAGRPLVKVWDSDGTAGDDGNVGLQPSGTVLDVDDFDVPSSAHQYDGLPLMLAFDTDQRGQSLELGFQTADGQCVTDSRIITEGLFFDDFDDANYTGWTVISGTWSAATRELYQSSSTSTRMIVAPGDRTDCAYEAKVKATSGTNPYIIFRYVNSTNYYTFGIVPTDDTARLGRVQSGTFYTTATTPFTCSTNTWYLLRVEVVGKTARAYVNCQQVLQVTDNAMGATGKIGLRTYATRAYFDDIRVMAHSALP